jgi:DNA-binding NtrC family response regulator/predicted hydrocarbon binding protein
VRAEDLRLEEIIHFSEGSLSLHGRRLVIHDIHAFAHLRKDLFEMLGAESARRILTRFGYFWGHADAAAMKRIFTWDSLEEWVKAGPRMHMMQGVVRVAVRDLKIDAASGRFRMEVLWRDSGEAEEHRISLGESREPSCWMLAGYASGYASFCLDRPVYFLEGKCRAKGDRLCTAVGKDLDSWGEEVRPHLPFFQAEDVHGKIMTLTQELRRRTQELARERKRLEEVSAPPYAEVRSGSFRRALDLASRAAPFDTSILIVGETGTGKEVLARHLHRHSKRSAGPFLGINCGALPETLLESELFGHRAGAFTGAVRDRTGLFEQASGGTIFLDEIGDIPVPMQTKLLRVLQEREVTRVGESLPRKVNVRVLAATHRDLPRAVREGRFREDLLYRLRVIEIEVPPLRERREDILPLARHFVETFAARLKRPRLRLDAASLDLLQAYRWPGNVRELENAIERAAVLSRDGVLRPQDFPPEVVRTGLSRGAGADPLSRSLADVEREHIRAVLERTGGRRDRAAEILGISPVTLWRRLRKQ